HRARVPLLARAPRPARPRGRARRSGELRAPRAERPRLRCAHRDRDGGDRGRRSRPLGARVARRRARRRERARRRHARRPDARRASPAGRRAPRGGARARADPARGRAAPVKTARLDTLPVELRERFAAGRVWAAHRAPYLASALLALDPVAVEREGGDPPLDLAPFPADPRWRLYIDPDALAVTEVPELGFWLLHQVGHLLRDHAARFPERDHAGPLEGRTPAQRRWNLAADAELDDDLDADELVAPERAVTPEGRGLPPHRPAAGCWDRLAESDRRAPAR